MTKIVHARQFYTYALLRGYKELLTLEARASVII